MSNRLSRARKGDKKPAIRQDEFISSMRALENKIQQLQYMIMENSYATKNIQSKFTFFIEYLTKKDVINEQDYKDYLKDLDEKMKLADEISKDESLSREDKISKAKEKDIPEDWVVTSEKKEESGEEAKSEDAPAATTED